MFNAKRAVLLGATALVGCTTFSSPTHTAYSVSMPDGVQAYRVTCYGLLEGPGSCRKAAEAICKDKPVTALEGQSLLGATSGGQPDTRNLLFQCGAPRAKPSVLPAAAAPAAPAAVAPMPKAITTLNVDANFDTAQANLTPAARVRLDQLIGDARGTSIRTVTVNGYTDSVGSDVYNLDLSERRAQAVLAYLRDHGLQAGKFAGRGYGEANPVASNATAAGRASNRRVDVLLDIDKQ
ncbi:OmpA family protein [Burkholderia sp. FERM BP-3421]|jgi:outer membrane protein OmpA-like peptidoglycan-associated protein|uniref:OmpA family protein n=1 Tax=Burkholderia sp. FERM BP-3421 TaxID=1494466 RepID=UPI0023617D08|nr:OmpA family protein [Burkholderia sp. FERM BP-3421]WDD94133.1 OmpA family protein [Burkholderia sp. FERM BP-3421]